MARRSKINKGAAWAAGFLVPLIGLGVSWTFSAAIGLDMNNVFSLIVVGALGLDVAARLMHWVQSKIMRRRSSPQNTH